MYPHLNKDSRDNILVTEPKDQKVLIAYHAHCIDGFTSAWACWKGLIETTDTLSEDIELMPVEYGKVEIVDAHLYSKIYFVDFSVSPEMLASLAKDTWICIIDHHKTAYEMYEGGCDIANTSFIMDLSECGASLVWKHFFGDRKMPQLIEFVKDYDLWLFTRHTTKAINKYLRIQRKDLAHWEEIAHDMDITVRMIDMAMQGNAIQAYHDSIVSDLVAQAEPCWLDDKEGLLVNCPQAFKDDVGHALELLTGTYGATWQQLGDGTVKWSLRSNGDYDVSSIAANFNGGGHKNAASFILQTPKEDAAQLGVTLWSSK